MANRTKNKPQVFTGLTLEEWQADVENIRWAQQEPRFRMLLSVLMNESLKLLRDCVGHSEGRALGKHEGFVAAIDKLQQLGERPPKPQVPMDDEYKDTREYGFRDTGPRDL